MPQSEQSAPDHWLVRAWYGGAGWLVLLRPLSCLFGFLSKWRKRRILQRSVDAWRSPVPVIVVGNISMGGTGKTPLVIALVEYLKRAGYKPGVISRGYGGKPPAYPYAVTPQSPPTQAGDEALLLAMRTGCPVVIDPVRVHAAQHLLADNDCNVIISDDGLQHYQLARHIEIAVLDGQRGLGNGRCLPEGPLREKPERLAEVDMVVVNGLQDLSLPVSPYQMTLEPECWQSLYHNQAVTLTDWPHQTVQAIAGIGNPARFFQTLNSLGLDVSSRSFPDHHQFQPEDLSFAASEVLVMTEKDAVKCRTFAQDNWWYLAVNARLADEFFHQLDQKLEALQ